MKAVMYGAGNIGRGFIGQIFAESGYEVTFIDVAEPVVEALNRDRCYPVRIVSGGAYEDRWIKGVGAVNGGDTERAAESIAAADIMATAVGVRALPLIAPVIAAGIQKRLALGRPLNIIICENLMDADKVLENLIKEHLSGGEQKSFDTLVGLVEASIGRMVPIQTPDMQDGNPLRVCVEAYGFLPVDKAAFKGRIPSIAGLRPFDNFDFYTQRKLFIHNMGHALCAYLGMLGGCEYMFQTVRHGGILFIAQNAMLESALALSAEFGVPLAKLHYHIRDLLRRFSNQDLGDTCARVGGDTSRKLGPSDRFIGAIKRCVKQSVSPAFISVGAAAALVRHLTEQGRTQNREEAAVVLKAVSDLEPDSAEGEMILSFYAVISQGGDFEVLTGKLITAAVEKSRKSGII